MGSLYLVKESHQNGVGHIICTRQITVGGGVGAIISVHSVFISVRGNVFG